MYRNYDGLSTEDSQGLLAIYANNNQSEKSLQLHS
jgi:hypothetical protein